MISIKLNFSEFIDSIKNRDKHIIISLAETEAKEAEKISEMMECGQDYVIALINFIYFLRYSHVSDSIKEEHLKLYRIVSEKLVAKKQLSSDLLKKLEPREKYSKIIGKI